METIVITIGASLIKLGVFGGLGATVITGIKWFSKYDPKLKKKSTTGGEHDESDGVESFRTAVRQRS